MSDDEDHDFADREAEESSEDGDSSSDDSDEEEEDEEGEQVDDLIDDNPIEASGSEEEGSNEEDEDGSPRKRKRSNSSDDDRLDDDDYALIAENIGIKLPRKKHRRVRLESDEEDEEDEETSVQPPSREDSFGGRGTTSMTRQESHESAMQDEDFAHVFGGDSDEDEEQDMSGSGKADVPKRAKRWDEDVKDDEMDDFIVDDRGRPIRRRKEDGTFTEPMLMEAQEVFGLDFDPAEFEQVARDGLISEEEELDEDLSDEEESPRKVKKSRVRKKKSTIYDVYEPSELERGHFLEKDTEIRITDKPERFQVRSVPVKASEHVGDLDDDLELKDQAEWIYDKAFVDMPISKQELLSADKYRPIGPRRYQGGRMLHTTVPKIKEALNFMKNHSLEVPFIVNYRREYVEPELNVHDLWKVLHLDEEWTQMQNRKKNMKALFERMRDYQFEKVREKPDTALTEDIRVLTDEDLARLDSVFSDEELSDVYAHFMLYYGRDLVAMQNSCVKRKKRPDDILEDDPEPEGSPDGPAGKSSVTRSVKKARRKDFYSICQEHGLGSLAAKFGLTPEQFGENMRDNYQRHETEQHPVEPEVAAEDYKQMTGPFTTIQAVLEGACHMVAMQISAEPLVRQALRQVFRSRAVISVKPTKKGRKMIDDSHNCVSMKYLRNKPVRELKGDEYLRLYLAEQEHLIEMKISIDADQASDRRSSTSGQRYFEEIRQLFYRDEFSLLVEKWNAQRAKAVAHALLKVLYPLMAKELRVTLLKEAKAHVLQSAILKFRKWLDVAPLSIKNADDSGGQYLECMACAYTHDKAVPSFFVFLDNNGEVKDFARFNHLAKRKYTSYKKESEDKQEDLEKLKNFIKKNQPQVIAISAESRDSVSLVQEIQEVVGELSQEEDLPPAPVELVLPHVARLFSKSKRGREMFPDYPEALKMSISIGRMMQEPLVEFTSLVSSQDDEFRSLPLHPLQGEISADHLKKALEEELVTRVNDVGVNIEHLREHPHAVSMLHYVCGLGPRKAAAILKTLKQEMITLQNRSQLVTQCSMGPQVFMNSAAFLRVTPSEMMNNDVYIEVLDSTRVHPENYEWARKMAEDALEYDENDTDDPSVVVEEIMQAPEKLRDLDLDAFAEELARQEYGNKRTTLYDIRNELSEPFKERRQPYTPLSQEELFTLFTGETEESLYEGRLFTCTVVGIVRRKPQREVLDRANPVQDEYTRMWKCPFCGKGEFRDIGLVWQHFDDGSCPGQEIGVRTRLENGLSGFILTRNLSDKPVTSIEERVHFGLSFTRPSSTNSYSSDKDSSLESVRSPSSQSSRTWGNNLPRPLPQADATSQSQSQMSQQRFIDEDDDGLGISANRRPHQQPPAHSESHAVMGNISSSAGGQVRSRPSQSYLRHLDSSEEAEHVDSGLSQQVEQLTTKNKLLLKQLEEREVERNRLREQLENHRSDKGPRSICSPPGLPSRLLDGRTVLTSPAITTSTPSSPHPQSQSPLPPPSSPLRMNSPQLYHLNYQPRTISPLPQSPHSRYPLHTAKDASGDISSASTSTSSHKRQISDSRRESAPTSPQFSASKQYIQQIEELKLENRDLEKRLRDVLEEKRRLEGELSQKKESFLKMQAREQDLSKDIELLRDENSHHTSAIKRLQTERDGLKSENESLHDELASLNDKLNKTEKCYKEVEHENLSLEAEIEQLVSDKKLLFEEKHKLQIAVEGALKTKESFRSTIKQLRIDNQLLEDSMGKQPGDSARGGAVGAPSRQKKVSEPATLAEKTLNEVRNLREEKSALQEKLSSTLQEIDSLEAHLKSQEFDDVSESMTLSRATGVLEESLQEKLAQHFSLLHSQVSRLQAELESVRGDLCIVNTHQQALVHDSFVDLVKKCRKLLSSAQEDKKLLSENLQLAELSLSKVMEDLDILKQENQKLQSQRNEMLKEVNRLKGEVSSLRDRERIQATRLAQSEALVQEKEDQVTELKSQTVKMEERYLTSEKNWKKVVHKMQEDFDGKEAELQQRVDIMSEEKEYLMAEKEELEAKLSQLQLENEKLCITRDGLLSELSQLEDRILSVSKEMNSNSGLIEHAQTQIASLLTQKVCLSAQLIVSEELTEEQMKQISEENDKSMAEIESEKESLATDLESLKADKKDLLHRLEEISKKEQHIDMLETKVACLKSSQDQMQSEMEVLTKKHSAVVREFQALEESQHAQRLEKEKLKMTLMTEIKLLQSKLSTIEGDKLKLETELAKHSGGSKQGAFQAVRPGTNASEMAVKKHSLAAQKSLPVDSKVTQQQKSGLSPSSEGNALNSRSANIGKTSDLQNRVVSLEKENKMLKEMVKKLAPTTSTPGSSHSDEEMVVSLRKKISDMTRKMFFMESEKQHLTEKARTLSVSLKAARDSKSRSSSEHAQKLQAENSTLQDRVRKLEETLTQKLMAADSKIVDTVSENDILKEKLLHIQAAFGSVALPKTESFQHTIAKLKSELESLGELNAVLVGSGADFKEVEAVQQEIETLQQDLQTYVSSANSPNMSPSSTLGGRNVPVFRSLPAGYLSNFQHRKVPGSHSSSPSVKSDSRSSSFSSPSGSSSELQKKVSDFTTAAVKCCELLKKRTAGASMKGAQVSTAQGCLDSLCEMLKGEYSRTKAVQGVLSSLQGVELGGARLAGEMKRRIESLQDQVMVRDSALNDIELQMKADFEAHQKKFTQVKSQVLELREQMSGMKDQLRTKDQYIHQSEEKLVAMETELFKVRKELESHVQGYKEFVRQALTDKMKMQGVNSVADIIRMQREEVSQLQKGMNDFSCKLSQVQTQLEVTQREKGMLMSKGLDLERLHVQIKEQMGADISYLRQLNLQMVERQVKADKASEILKEVISARSAFQKQKDVMKLESELDAAKIKLSKQNLRIVELESQISSQTVAIKILQAEKDHSISLQHHTPPEMTNQISRMNVRPRSAESASARKPKYKISDKSRVGLSGLAVHGEFSIVLPSQNARHGDMDILNLEEQPELGLSPHMRSLGPMVVTDDEYTGAQEVEKVSLKKERQSRLKMIRHRRTASMDSTIIPSSKDRDGSSGSSSKASSGGSSLSKSKMGPGGSKTLPSRQILTPLQLSLGASSSNKAAEREDSGTLKRPGSAESTSRQIFPGGGGSNGEGQQLLSPSSSMLEGAFHDYSPTPVNKNYVEDGKRGSGSQMGVVSSGMHSDGDGGRGLMNRGASVSSSSIGVKGEGKVRYDSSRHKPINKSTDSNETTSSEGNGFSSKSSSQSDSSAGGGGGVASGSGMRMTLKRPDHHNLRQPANMSVDLSRTESMSSTCSTLSIFNSNLPSRNESFTYDGGEESSTYEYERVEITDSVENLQTLGKIGYSPYFSAIAPSESYTTSSSDDENYRKNYRKKSSTNTGDNTPRHRDLTYPGSNSSGESDSLGAEGYRDKSGEKARLADIPAHVNESISISDMDREATDIEIEDKANTLQKCFQDPSLKQCIGRKRYSSTGSVKICYSESSMEDISKN